MSTTETDLGYIENSVRLANAWRELQDQIRRTHTAPIDEDWVMVGAPEWKQIRALVLGASEA